MRSFQLWQSRSSASRIIASYAARLSADRCARIDVIARARVSQLFVERLAMAAGDGRRVVFRGHDDMKTQPWLFGKCH
jgi:hypothetical protein